ncbi:MAG: nodulation protein NfeD [Bacteroidia bacterium]|nr:nodulation protein NfeD [Bacteroidia bacterium]
MKHFLSLALLFLQIQVFAQDSSLKIVHFKVQEEISPSASRLVKKALATATEQEADAVILELDTYGGLLLDADSIRIDILDFEKPVYAFINKNSGSAGALISIACDKIFMAPGATIGSATVVDGSGQVLPDKYQSYMRSIMRSTAESHGSDTLIQDGDTSIVYVRDPKIAEAMVDERIEIEGLIPNDRILAFTTSEAIDNHYCEGEAESLNDIFKQEGWEQPTVVKVEKSRLDKIVGFLANPALQGALIMIIFWGIFFEIRTPGIGFPLAAAVAAAMLYFAPLYLDGLAANWEILLFIVGIVLIGFEVFVIPGFGVAGITGILLTVGSLVLSLIRNVDFDFSTTTEDDISAALLMVFIALVGFILGAFLFGRGMMSSPLFKRLVLSDTLKDAKAGVHIPTDQSTNMVGKKGKAHTSIRPMGKAKIDGVIMDVKSMGDFIDEGANVRIVSKELGYWVVEEIG